MRERKGPGTPFAREEGARAALCVRGRGQGSSVREMKGPGQPFAQNEGFYHNFFTFLTFLTFLGKVRNVRNVRNVILRVAVVVKK